MESMLKGKILVATPAMMADPNFAETLVLIVQHDADGAMGLILNRPLETTVGEAWTQVSAVPYANEDPLFQGGPVNGPLMVVHQEPDCGQLEIGGGAYWSSDAEMVRRLVLEGMEPVKFFVGYSGWGSQQLESELQAGAWLVAPIESGQIFATPAEMWSGLIKQSRQTLVPKVDPRRIPPDPSVN